MFNLVRRPFGSAFLLGAPGGLASVYLPSVFASQGWVYSPELMATTLACATVMVLVPLGLVRGGIGAVKEIVVDGGMAASAGRQMFEHGRASLGGSPMGTTSLHDLAVKGNFTLGSGVQGTLGRVFMSPFLPSTAMMMERVEEVLSSASSQAKACDSEMAAVAVSGLVEGYIQDKKDTVTMVGAVIFALVVGAGAAADYAYFRTAKKGREIKQSVLKKGEDVKQSMKDTKEHAVAKREEMKQGLQEHAVAKREDMKQGIQDAHHRALKRISTILLPADSSSHPSTNTSTNEGQESAKARG
jgi:hypothetical protein